MESALIRYFKTDYYSRIALELSPLTFSVEKGKLYSPLYRVYQKKLNKFEIALNVAKRLKA